VNKLLQDGLAYSSFSDFMTRYAIPLEQANPAFRRLDGERSGGNRTIAGSFVHDGRRWVVHADTHFRPLRIAYNDELRDPAGDPFKREVTRAGTCLVLRDDLRRIHDSPHKYLYIYDAGAARS
jgi:hypothetical protein